MLFQQQQQGEEGGGSNGVSGSMSNGEAKPIQGTNELISRQQAGVGVGGGVGDGVGAAAGGDITCMIDCAVVQRIVAGAGAEHESALHYVG